MLFQEVLAAVSTSAMTPVLRVVFRKGTNTPNFHKWNVCCWDGSKNGTGGARELKWNGNRFFIIIVGNITPPPRGHGTGVGSKKMAKGRKERQKGMKLEEEYRRRNKELRLKLKAEWMEQEMPEEDKAEEAPHHTYSWLTFRVTFIISLYSGSIWHLLLRSEPCFAKCESRPFCSSAENPNRKKGKLSKEPHQSCLEWPGAAAATESTQTPLWSSWKYTENIFFCFKSWFFQVVFRSLRIHLPLSKDGPNAWDFQALSAFAAVSSYNPAVLPSETKWVLPSIQWSPQTTFKLIWHPSGYNNPGSEALRLTLGLPCTLQAQ